MSDIKVSTAEQPRWPIEDIINDDSFGYNWSEPDEVWFLGGAQSDDGAYDYDLWLGRWNNDNPDVSDDFAVFAVRQWSENEANDADGVYSVSSEATDTIDYTSHELLIEGMRRALERKFTEVPEHANVETKELFDARRTQGVCRHNIPDAELLKIKRNHRDDALYLGKSLDSNYEICEIYFVPSIDGVLRKNSDKDSVNKVPRVYALHAHDCGNIKAWWSDGNVPTDRALRTAIRVALDDDFEFDVSVSDILDKTAKEDGVTDQNPTGVLNENEEQAISLPKTNSPTNQAHTAAMIEETPKKMTKVNIDKSGKKFNHVTVIVAEDEQIHLPAGMSKASAVQWLKQLEANEEQVVNWSETIDAYPLDGALALSRVLEHRFGGAVKTGATKMTWFGEVDIPPFMVSIEVGVGETAHVPWGHFIIPTMSEHKIKAGVEYKNSQLFFKLSGDIKKKYQPLMDDIAEQVRDELTSGSIYKAQAFRLSFPTDEQLESENYSPHDYAPRFMRTASHTDTLIFSETVQEQIDTNLFAPIRYTDECRKHGIPLKRGVLLAGKYGTGKTLTAFVTSKECVENGWTFVYLDKVADLEKAMRFAKRYEPAVIFAEDIDSVMEQKNGSARDVAMNQILNTIDGVDMKKAEQIVVLTSNFVDRINKGMLRPGRLDAVIIVEPPDQKAAIRLFRQYAHGLLDKISDAELMPAAQLMAGQIPSVIREVTERSKLAAIDRSKKAKTSMESLAGSDMLIAATGIAAHIKLLEDPPIDHRSDLEKAADKLVEGILQAQNKSTSNGLTGHHAPTKQLGENKLSGVSDS